MRKILPAAVTGALLLFAAPASAEDAITFALQDAQTRQSGFFSALWGAVFDTAPTAGADLGAAVSAMAQEDGRAFGRSVAEAASGGGISGGMGAGGMGAGGMGAGGMGASAAGGTGSAGPGNAGAPR